MARFLRTPKGLLLILLAALLALAPLGLDADTILPNLTAATATAAAIDIAFARLRRNEWIFPDGAFLTGIIIAMVLRPQEPAYVAVLAATLATASKHLLRTHWSNVFNPAALGLVVAAIAFQSGQSWWGALPDLGVAGVAVLVIIGTFITARVNKLPMVLVFMGAYFSLFTVASFFTDATTLGEVYRAPDLHAVLFFAFFMLDDPPTSPVRYEDQAVFGIIVATAAYFIFMTLGTVYFLPAALLTGNAWESARRLATARARTSRRRLPA